MRNKKIGLDLDGVLYPFHKTVYGILTRYHSLSMDYKPFWHFAREIGYMQREITDLVNIAETYLTGKISDINKKAINELVFTGNEIFYVTARPFQMESITKMWLLNQGLPFANNLKIGSHSKIKSVVGYKCDVFVDDRNTVVEEIKNVTRAIMYKADYHYLAYVMEYEYINNLWELVEMEV